MSRAGGSVRVRTVVERKHASLPRYVVIPASSLAGWELSGTVVVEARLNGIDVGRRSLKRWGSGRDVWFFDLTAAQCERAGVDAGRRVDVELVRADERPPAEIETLVRADPEAARAWDSLSQARRRQLAEHVRSAKQPETRRRRAARGLGIARE